jgi:hypothetical protein
LMQSLAKRVICSTLYTQNILAKPRAQIACTAKKLPQRCQCVLVNARPRAALMVHQQRHIINGVTDRARKLVGPAWLIATTSETVQHVNVTLSEAERARRKGSDAVRKTAINLLGRLEFPRALWRGCRAEPLV